MAPLCVGLSVPTQAASSTQDRRRYGDCIRHREIDRIAQQSFTQEFRPSGHRTARCLPPISAAVGASLSASQSFGAHSFQDPAVGVGEAYASLWQARNQPNFPTSATAISSPFDTCKKTHGSFMDMRSFRRKQGRDEAPALPGQDQPTMKPSLTSQEVGWHPQQHRLPAFPQRKSDMSRFDDGMRSMRFKCRSDDDT